MKKRIVIFGIISTLLVLSAVTFATETTPASSNTFNFNHVRSIDPLSTLLLGLGDVSYNSKAQALNVSISRLCFPILSKNFMFLKPLELNSINTYLDTVTIFGFIPLELGIGAQYIMQSGFFVGGDLDLTIIPWLVSMMLYIYPPLQIPPIIPWANVYVGSYY